MDDASASDCSDRYNRIHSIEEQKRAAEEIDLPNVLRSAAQILLQHGAHLNFGISLVHRHQDLAPNCAMIHSYDAPGSDTCHMERLMDVQIFPQAYHLDRDGFLPYEYSFEPTHIPEAPMLDELAALLRREDASELIGLFHIKELGALWLERPSSHGNGTTATRLPQGNTLSSDIIVTEWIKTRRSQIRKGDYTS
ncbi:hypothetical protein CERZMDRAFT_107329 [Cercospora zeae-maydis SCOH1-5]|uniref:Uncharacterized protein n=1 Tax=Cercospora zeae-maydis SCOH1-5 TaxID=717836 RepID=A0A6A6F5A6_9PEZI|nr:hypothetical protein CERZMDRAFT_107329 [Cercospora zeae-maydis SCOH1-5]